MLVLTILGLLARLGFPRYSHLRRQAEARAIIGDVQAVRVAAFNYNTEKQAWPAESGQGTVPPELDTYLPGGFAFRRSNYVMDWQVWPGAGNGSNALQSSAVIGLTIDTPDTLLISALRSAATVGIPYIVSGTQTTFLLAGFGGNY